MQTYASMTMKYIVGVNGAKIQSYLFGTPWIYGQVLG